MGIKLDELNCAILEYLDNDGRATPVVVHAHLESLENIEVPTRQTVNDRLSRMALAGYLKNVHSKGLYEIVDDPRE